MLLSTLVSFVQPRLTAYCQLQVHNLANVTKLVLEFALRGGLLTLLNEEGMTVELHTL